MSVANKVLLDSPNDDTFTFDRDWTVYLNKGKDKVAILGGIIHVYGFNPAEDLIDISTFTNYHHYTHLYITEFDSTSMKIYLSPTSHIILHMSYYPSPADIKFIFKPSEC